MTLTLTLDLQPTTGCPVDDERAFDCSMPFQRTYVVKVTNAPQCFDGGTTVRIAEDISGHRIGKMGTLVLIEADQLAWHDGRYRSGLYWLDEPDALIFAADVLDLLVTRFLDR